MFIINPYAYASTSGSGYQTETNTWESRQVSLGGTVTTADKDIADALVVALRAKSYYGKLVYMLPLLGAGIANHRVPLIDTLNVGAANNTGPSPFTDSDCDSATGLVNSTEKGALLDTNITPNQLGVSGNGGLGFWERNWGAGSGVEPIGCYDTGSNRFVIDLRSTLQRFRWGTASGSEAGPGTTASSGHYYGQRSSTTLRQIYKDGMSLGSDGTSSQAGTPVSALDRIFVMGCNASTDTYWKGRCAVAYMTDGTLSSGDVADLHATLSAYLIAPTGR